MDIYEHGHWEGDKFITDEPLVINGEQTGVHELDFSHMIAPAGLDRDMMVEAFLDPTVEAVPVDPDDYPFGHLPSQN